MPLIYHDPSTVLSPRDYVSNVRVIFDGGATGANPFSIAKVAWEGTDCYAMRWNVSAREYDDPAKISGSVTCVGMPASRGYPVWFIVPLDVLFNQSGDVYEKLKPFLK